MPSIFNGIRTFIGALAKGADNIVYSLFGTNAPPRQITENMSERFPDLPAVGVQQVTDFTELSKTSGESISRLRGNAKLPVSNLPLNPSMAGTGVYWVDVEWFDPRSGETGRRLTILQIRPGETKSQFERRAIEEAEDIWDDYPEFDSQGKRINPEFKRVTWLRGMQGTGTP